MNNRTQGVLFFWRWEDERKNFGYIKDKERSIHELQHVLDLNNSEGFTVLLKALNQLEDEGKIVRNDKMNIY